MTKKLKLITWEEAVRLGNETFEKLEKEFYKGDDQSIDWFDRIEQELERQNEKWGTDRDLNDRTWVTVLLEEVGEVAHAVLEHDLENLQDELVQVAAVCVSFLRNTEKYEDS